MIFRWKYAEKGMIARMFVMTAKVSRKKLRLILLLLAAAAVTVLTLRLWAGRAGTGASEPPIVSNEDRIAYLRSWGWELESEPLETLQLLLPDSLPKSYAQYNSLQKTQGFDLENCCGKQITRYTYTVTNYPERPEKVQVNLYICEGQPVAGDIIASGADGFQTGLAFPESNKT